ncbi:TonB-dependent receptor [Aequorivita lipolytica]|uniref:TonB-dependent receptor n=1 Tax=Aequorivita lipolytica TaxID=153267 RepID=A0A5C6YP72_9FLAO|nr:TonB-dependent receptor [Aequorivita lipolytica]TXD69017.1 TonB-dependent receptor [Aequorivita lipolytica]SRX52938.1 Vitamin B12 transporter BtuB [Aequorivita lipolytica]
MSKKRILLFSFIIVVLSGISAFSQEKELDTEVVNIVKPYTPTISDAFKVKETPTLNDSISTTKKEVKYSIFSVPVASTFTPSKGKATTVEKTKPIKLYDNYATLGFGNYTSILGEFYSNFEISRTDNAGFFFRHNSSQGDIEGVKLDNKYYDTSLDANYTSRQKDATYRLDAGVEHQLYNWYGVPEIVYIQEPNVQIDPQQTYISGYAGGSIALDDSFFERAAVNIRYLGDAFSSSEFNATLKPEFSFPLENLTFKIDGDIDYLSGSFDRNYTNTSDIKYSFLNVGLVPSINFVNNDLSVSLGVAAYVSLDSENSDTDFSLYPRLNASYRLLDETVILYGGAEGGLQQNTYYNFKEENPFVSPTLNVAPTKKLYEGFGGIKGKLSNSVAYNVRASYGKDENKALFQANFINLLAPGLEGYQFGNSFNIVYDDVNTLAFFAELKVEVSDKFSLGINGTYNSYSTDLQNEAWNLPDLKASVFSNFNITEKLYGGASLFYVGERKDLHVDPYNTQEVTLDGYVDANLSFGYRFTDRLSAFVKGSNLFGDNYEKWLNYPVQGIQGLAGVTYKFDW